MSPGLADLRTAKVHLKGTLASDAVGQWFEVAPRIDVHEFQEGLAVIQQEFDDAAGRRQRASPEAVAAIQQLLGADVCGVVPLFLRPGEAVGPGTIVLEDGSEREVRRAHHGDLPVGYHRFVDEAGDWRPLIVSPGRCHLPAGLREWGWAVQLPSARSRSSWGIGDFGDLQRLGEWARNDGAGFLLVNPLRAVAPVIPQQPSPYSPTSRRFLNPLQIDVDAVAAASARHLDIPDLGELRRLGRALTDWPLVERNKVAEVKFDALRRIWEAINGDARTSLTGFDQWLASNGSVEQFALWCCLCEDHGPDWRTWPAALRRPDTSDVAAYAARHRERIRFHGWLQWLADSQLGAATESIRIVQDLPIGFDVGGADAWCWQDLLALDASVGAPPDEFNTEGQDWGLPPFVPARLRAAGYEPFIDTVRRSLATGGGLRIDHVMGLFRLWWVPPGMSPADGAYVRYPAEDLLDIVAIESQRHQAVVVGEDLGTVEPGVRDELAARDILSYRLLWFEEQHPSAWPTKAMAAVTTHDLPTVAGLWSGSDVDELRRLDVPRDEVALQKIRDGLRDATGLDDEAEPAAAIAGAYELVAETPSMLLCASLEDAFAAEARPNVPGAPDSRPNWSIALPRPIEDISEVPGARTISRKLQAGIERAVDATRPTDRDPAA